MSANGNSDYQYIFKIILIGSSGVGKSSIITRFMDQVFNQENTKSTIGVDFKTKTMEVDNKTVKLQIWDTAGQEKFRSMSSSYYRRANVAFVVFDLTVRASFEALPTWIETYYKNGPEDQKNIILIGNKKDLVDQRQITQEEAELFSETNNMIYFETSAKEGENIEYVFRYAAKKLLDFYSTNEEHLLKKQLSNNSELQAQNFKEIRIEKTEKKKCC